MDFYNPRIGSSLIRKLEQCIAASCQSSDDENVHKLFYLLSNGEVKSFDDIKNLGLSGAYIAVLENKIKSFKPTNSQEDDAEYLNDLNDLIFVLKEQTPLTPFH